MSGDKHEFKAEVSALLKLVTNSLYTNSEIFLRELISNSSDALDKARFTALVDDTITGKDEQPKIAITADEQRGVLTIEDSGIGMTRDEVETNLGTIAHSGTLRYLEQAQKDGKGSDVNLIGQFGVGFYSAFMVASSVKVTTLSATLGAEAICWTSDGDGEYTLTPGDRSTRGTTIELTLKEDHKEFLQRFRLQDIVRRYSNYVTHPIFFKSIDAEGKIEESDEKLNAASAIWARSSDDVGDEEYSEFYKHLMGGFVLPGDQPPGRLHFSMDAPIQFNALLFVPGRVPQDLFQESRKSLQLFARRIMVMESCDQLLPQYLRFFRGVVDSEDLPLNVSREMLQENKAVSAIRRQLTRKALRLLTDLAKDDKDTYTTVWTNFGAVLKEGIHFESNQRKELVELLRWRSVDKGDELISLADYVENMADEQEFIYYIAGQNEASLRTSPHLEALRSKGYDAFLMTDPVDEWVLQSMPEHDGKKFRSITQGELETDDESKETDKDESSSIQPLLAKATELLADRVRQVKSSKRLTESAACLVDDAAGLSSNMERILRMTQGENNPSNPPAARILELNAQHKFVRATNVLATNTPDDPRLATWIEILLDLASLAEGSVADPAGTIRRFQTVLDTVVDAETD